MVSGASLEPSMATPSRFSVARVALAGWACGAAPRSCFSSSCRIWRSSFRIWSACWRVMPISGLAALSAASLATTWAVAGSTSANGSAASTVYRIIVFISHLILSQDQHVLAVRNVFPFGVEMKVVGLNLFDHVRHVQPDVGQRPPVGHGALALVILDYHQPALGLERFVDRGQHLLGEIAVVVHVQDERDVNRAFRQFRIRLGAFDESYVL